ncbi:MAG TPA: FtsX-like permease family protein, partial [Bryobacteraceae bacterium]|nr:FtsX-like permease family protein [Bryobacteraceae bacterium]
DPNTMYLLAIDPVRDGYAPEKAENLFQKLPQQLKTIGAVRGIALAAEAPFSISGAQAELTTARDSSAKPVSKLVSKETVGASYFKILSEPMLSGREFTDRDQMAVDTLPAVLNESAAQALFGNAAAVGQRVTEDQKSYEVVGVVPDLKNGIPDDDQPTAVIYLPLTLRDFSSPPPGGMTILVRSDAGVDALAAVRRMLAATDPDLAVFNVRTLSEHLELSRASMRLALDVYGAIGLFGLVLAAIGLAGVTAYAVARRRREIGIRMALGSSKAQVLRLVLREGSALVAIGTVLGLLGAMAMVKMLSALTSIVVEAFKLGTDDPRLVVGAPVLLAAIAMLACYLPARRSTKIDPLKALRQD